MRLIAIKIESFDSPSLYIFISFLPYYGIILAQSWELGDNSEMDVFAFIFLVSLHFYNCLFLIKIWACFSSKQTF